MAASSLWKKTAAILALGVASLTAAAPSFAGDTQDPATPAGRRTDHCVSSATARTMLTEAVVGAEQLAARIDSGRPSSNDRSEHAETVGQWLARAEAAQFPSGEPRQDGRLWAYVPLNHRDAMRILCDAKSGAACAMCAWYEVQATGSKLWIPVDGRVALASAPAAEQLLVAELQTRTRLAETVQLARLVSATNPQ